MMNTSRITMTSGTAKPSTVFFGSGPVAAASLEKLLMHTLVEAVITKPRPIHHRGAVPVLELAQIHNLPVFTVASRSELDTLVETHSFASTYAVLIDFGIIVSQQAINAFPLGIINSHFSLLPHLRGADPITWAIVNGDDKTGVSLMCVDVGLDTGKLLTSKTLRLDCTETTPILTDKLIDLSDQLLQEYLPLYLSGELKPHNQPHPDRATYSRKLTKGDGHIDWNEPAAVIERKIRGFIDWPGSRAQFGELDVVITSAHVVEMGQAIPGKLMVEKKRLLVGTGENWLEILSLKPAGKKEMPIQAFLAGYRHKL